MKWHFFSGNEATWDAWLLEQKQADFLQSFAWGKFQTAQGRKVLRFQAFEGEKLMVQVQAMVHTLAFGLSYLYVPRVLVSDEMFQSFCEYISTQGFCFVRVEPIDTLNQTSFREQPTHHRQYRHSLRLALLESEESILKSFHSKTRYNIRLAQKKGVVIRTEKNNEVFWNLVQETSVRDHIKSHSKAYYQGFLDLPECTQMTAYYNEKPLASVLLYTFGDVCVYVHGASSNECRNVMAPYLLQWEAMRFAKQKGLLWYDFGGVAAPQDADEEKALSFHQLRWATDDKLSGVTRFKAGFGGERIEYGAAFDILFAPWQYRLYTLARKFL